MYLYVHSLRKILRLPGHNGKFLRKIFRYKGRGASCCSDPLCRLKDSGVPNEPRKLSKNTAQAVNSPKQASFGFCRGGRSFLRRARIRTYATKVKSEPNKGKIQKAPVWWAWVDLNYRPHAYQACALTT